MKLSDEVRGNVLLMNWWVVVWVGHGRNCFAEFSQDVSQANVADIIAWHLGVEPLSAPVSDSKIWPPSVAILADKYSGHRFGACRVHPKVMKRIRVG